MKPLIALLCVLSTLSTLSALAASPGGYLGDSEGSIIQVTRKLRMSNKEPLAPKEFYLDIGRRNGAREGDLYEVFRMVPITDALGGGDWHLMRVSLGEIKVDMAGETTCLARVHLQRRPEDLPAMDYTAFMVGDQVRKKTSLPFR